MINQENLLELSDIEKQTRIFELLKYLKDVCDRNAIPYSLFYGTLLGAKRHKGFIPWDDDVDICLLRKDYERLIQLLKQDAGPYRVMDSANNDTYYYNYAKLVDAETLVVEHGYRPIRDYGLYVDIFPLDNCPDNERDFERLVKKIRIYSALKTVSALTSLNVMDSPSKKAAAILLFPIAKILGYKYWVKKLNRLLTSYENSETVSVCCLTENPKYKEVLSRSEIFPPHQIEFHGERFSCIGNTEEYLTNRYGDYMQLPPEDKRVSHHICTAYKK